MKKIDIIKAVTSTIVGIGTTKIVRTIINNNINPETLSEKITMEVGSIAVGGMVADAASSYTDAKIDEIAETIQKIQNLRNAH